MRVTRTLFASLALATVTAPAIAYEVTPMIYDMQPSGKGATAVIRIANTDSKPVTFEVVAEKRTFDENGKDTRTPADDDFVLFPPQGVVQPGATQAVRIQYVGKPQLSASEMYLITVKQVPVELPQTGPSAVQFVFNFSTLANIVPDGAAPKIEVVSVTPTASGLALRVHNSGNRYANISVSKVTLTGPGYSHTVQGDDWAKVAGASWILPGADRVFNMPKPTDAPTQLSATFDLVDPK